MSDKDEKRKRDAASARRDPDLAGLESTLQDLAAAADGLVDRLFEAEPAAPESTLSENPLRGALDELAVDDTIDALQIPEADDPGPATLSVVSAEGALEPSAALPPDSPVAAKTPQAEPESVWTSPATAGTVDVGLTAPSAIEIPEPIEPAPIQIDTPVAPEPNRVEIDIPEPVARSRTPDTPVGATAGSKKDRPLFSEPAKGPTEMPNYIEQAPDAALAAASGNRKPWLAAGAILTVAVAGGLLWQSSRSPRTDASASLKPAPRAVTLAPAPPDRSAGDERTVRDWPPPPPRLPDPPDRSTGPEPAGSAVDTATSSPVRPDRTAETRQSTPPTPRPETPRAAAQRRIPPKTPPSAPRTAPARTASPKPPPAAAGTVGGSATPKPSPAVAGTAGDSATPKPSPAPPKPAAATLTPKPSPPVPQTVTETVAETAPPKVETQAERTSLAITPAIEPVPAPPEVGVPVFTQAAMIERAEPVYPKALRKTSGGGVVKLEALVGQDGRVLKVLIKQGIPGSELEGRAIDALLRSTFRPATRDGQPYAVWVMETYVFDP